MNNLIQRNLAQKVKKYTSPPDDQCHCAVMYWLLQDRKITVKHYKKFRKSDRTGTATQVFFGNGKKRVKGPKTWVPRGHIVGFFSGNPPDHDNFLQHTLVSLGFGTLVGLRSGRFGGADGYGTLKLNKCKWQGGFLMRGVGKKSNHVDAPIAVFHSKPKNIDKSALE